MLSEWVPDGVDITMPNAARVYDHALGGFHNFKVDRQLAEEAEQVWPGFTELAHANRAYLGRVVRWLAGAGVRQFLDIGSGIPALGNVHDVAQHASPDAKVVYVDIDPVAVAHGRRILADNPCAVALRGDLRRPQQILGHPEVVELLDFAEPVGVLLVAVLHFVGEEHDPAGIIEQFADATVEGSYLAISHLVPSAQDAADLDGLCQLYRRTPTSLHPRNREQLAGLLTGWQVLDPGLVPVNAWRPDPEDAGDPPQLGSLAAVVRRPSMRGAADRR